MSIRLKLILSICGPLLVGYAVILWWDYHRSFQRAVEWSENRVAERAVGSAAQVNERLISIQQIVDTTAAALTGRPLSMENQVRGALFSSFRPHPWISGIWLAFDKDAPRPPSMPQIMGLRRDNPVPDILQFDASKLNTYLWFTRAKEWNKGAWTDPTEAGQLTPTNRPVVIYSSPFYSGDRFAGVVSASIELESLQHLQDEAFLARRSLRRPEDRRSRIPPEPVSPAPISKPVALSKGGYFIIDTQGSLISHPDQIIQQDFVSQLSDHTDQAFLKAVREAMEGERQRLVTTHLADFVSGYQENETYIVALEPISATRWVLVTAVLQSEMLGGIQDQLIKRAGLLALTMGMLLLIVLVVAKRFCRPIEKLASRVQAISSGNLDLPPIPVVSNDEIGRLAAGFNRMTEQLRHQFAAIEQQTIDREKVEGELRIARQIQLDLLPRTFPPFPDRTEFDLHAMNVPARTIGGDFFDFFFVDPDKLILTIADVSGKGVPAALMMAVTRTVVRNLATEGLSPLQILDRTNARLMADSTTGMFVTMILAQYQPSTGRLMYVNAGHPPGILYGQDEPQFVCHSTGPIIGIDDGKDLGPAEQHELVLRTGEGILFYTDGVTEARDPDNTLFGNDRLLQVARSARGGPCQAACERIVQQVLDFQQDGIVDDLTLLCLRRLN
ncbi:MAG: hypothetical protein KatS3mg104_1752 [Phycisphaerae bacterium]|jgi:sigma-B regulation protein RsbU (phosphoserine phosphatase)|nr:MAG: hypothetical protein KatS3mg104_1752 [Phycisphaerae bacterium]